MEQWTGGKVSRQNISHAATGLPSKSVICVGCLSFTLMISFVPFRSQPILALYLDKKNSKLDCLIVTPLDQYLCLAFL